MAAPSKDVESRPSQAVSETRVVAAGVNPDDETRTKVGEVADGVDKDTRDLIIHDTTTRERTVNAKRAHEPLDADAAEDDQPDEAGNGPRAAEVGGSVGPTETVSGLKVSEAQIKAGADARDGTKSGEK